MKKITFLLAFMVVSFGYSQVPLPWDFESAPTTANVTGFDGASGVNPGNCDVAPNDMDNGSSVVEAVQAPQSTGNSSANLLKIIRDGCRPWAGAFIDVDADLDFSTQRYINVDIWTDAPVGTTIMMKTEEIGVAGNNSGEKNVVTTVTGTWETLSFDFNGVANAAQRRVVIIPDNGNFGDGSSTSTFYFDNFRQSANLSSGDFAELDLTTTPNPSKGKWVVRARTNISEVQLYDTLGKLVLSIEPKTREVEIDGSSLRTGLYFAKVRGDNGSATLKLVRK